MSLLLGIDTGGTYTDAVLVRDDHEIVAKAKALTTREDLSLGICSAVRQLLDAAGVDPAKISMASLSTTLATNALVEGQGEPVGLIYIGFAERDLGKYGLRDALKDDPVLCLDGGHTHSGAEAQALDETALRTFLDAHADQVSGFAVAGLFATRNPGHERRVAEIIAAQTARPVTCTYQLSAKLNGPKRALTAVLNARLIGLIDRAITHTESGLVSLGISAPLMVVRGDGALMSAKQARSCPVETILSGPAASLVGAQWLTGLDTAIVSDIGGTTTDVAMIQEGRLRLDPTGAKVGGHHTMVEAVAIQTIGLGGDSEVKVQTEGLRGGVKLGPRRVVPICLVATRAPEIVHRALDGQLASPVVNEYDTRFVWALAGQNRSGLSDREQAVLERIGAEVQPLGRFLRSRLEQSALDRLLERGLVQLGGVTPSDACHVLRMQQSWDTPAAEKAMSILARRRVGSGEPVAQGAEQLAKTVVAHLREASKDFLVATVFAEEADAFPGHAMEYATHPLLKRGLAQHSGLISLNARLNVDLVGLGASARSYYEPLDEDLGTRMHLPDHGDVANAIGAVVGRISTQATGLIISPVDGVFRVHLADAPQDFPTYAEAYTMLEASLRQRAKDAALSAGAVGVQVDVSSNVKTAQVESREIFVEAEVTVRASGRPRVTVDVRDS